MFRAHVINWPLPHFGFWSGLVNFTFYISSTPPFKSSPLKFHFSTNCHFHRFLDHLNFEKIIDLRQLVHVWLCAKNKELFFNLILQPITFYTMKKKKSFMKMAFLSVKLWKSWQIYLSRLLFQMIHRTKLTWESKREFRN